MALPSTVRSNNSCSMAEFRVDCLTYAHSRARPDPSLTSPDCGLPPTATIPVRRLINIGRPSRLEPRTIITGNVCSHHTESNALPTEIRDRRIEGCRRSRCNVLLLLGPDEHPVPPAGDHFPTLKEVRSGDVSAALEAAHRSLHSRLAMPLYNGGKQQQRRGRRIPSPTPSIWSLPAPDSCTVRK